MHDAGSKRTWNWQKPLEYQQLLLNHKRVCHYHLFLLMPVLPDVYRSILQCGLRLFWSVFQQGDAPVYQCFLRPLQQFHIFSLWLSGICPTTSPVAGLIILSMKVAGKRSIRDFRNIVFEVIKVYQWALKIGIHLCLPVPILLYLFHFILGFLHLPFIPSISSFLLFPLFIPFPSCVNPFHSLLSIPFHYSIVHSIPWFAHDYGIHGHC